MGNNGVWSAAVILLGLYLLIQLITIYYKAVIVIIALTLAFFIWKYQKKKRLELWPVTHIEMIGQAISPQIELAKKYQDQLLSDPYYKKGLPEENHVLYHDLEERANYLNLLYPKLCQKFNDMIIPHYPYLKPVENLSELQEALEYLEYRAGIQLFDLDTCKTDSSTRKAIDVLFNKYGIDHSFVKETLLWVDAPFRNKMNHMFQELYSETQIIGKGIEGEKKVQDELELYRDIWIALYNVRIETEGTSVESDAIVVSSKGVFSIEAKNFGSSGKYHIKVTKDGQWQKIHPNGEFEIMKDVASQVNRHIGFKQRFINTKLKDYQDEFPYVYIESIIVIANDEVTITNESDQVILRASQIYNFIKNRADCLSPSQVERLSMIFEKNRLAPKKYPHHDYELILESWLRVATPIFLLGAKLGNALAAYHICLSDHSYHDPQFRLNSIVTPEYSQNYGTAGMLGDFYSK